MLCSMCAMFLEKHTWLVDQVLFIVVISVCVLSINRSRGLSFLQLEGGCQTVKDYCCSDELMLNSEDPGVLDSVGLKMIKV